MLYTCDDPFCAKRAQILVANLAAIGIHVEVNTFPGNVLFKKLARKGEPYDIASSAWINDGFFDPYDFLNLLFDGNLANFSNSHFDDTAYNRRLEAAAKLTWPARYRAYARLDADLTKNAAPVIAWSTPGWQELLSARMGCQIYELYGGMNLAALCIRGHSRR